MLWHEKALRDWCKKLVISDFSMYFVSRVEHNLKSLSELRGPEGNFGFAYFFFECWRRGWTKFFVDRTWKCVKSSWLLASARALKHPWVTRLLHWWQSKQWTQRLLLTHLIKEKDENWREEVQVIQHPQSTKTCCQMQFFKTLYVQKWWLNKGAKTVKKTCVKCQKFLLLCCRN